MRAGFLRILPISHAGGTPLPMAGRLTQLAKIIFRDLYNRPSAVACTVTPTMTIKRKRPSDCSKGRFVRGRLPTLPGYQYHRRGGA